MPPHSDPAPLMDATDTAASPADAADAALDDRLDKALEESFPASDPVAVHRPDRLD
jgi:hypothetical protein